MTHGFQALINTGDILLKNIAHLRGIHTPGENCMPFVLKLQQSFNIGAFSEQSKTGVRVFREEWN